MRKYFQNKYAMSEDGANDLIKSILWSIAMDISFMLPVVFAFQFLNNSLPALFNSIEATENRFLYYLIIALVSLGIMFVIAAFQYESTYCRIYDESAKARINLAETLRKLPLSFFGKIDIADLSSTIMEDATQIEHLFSHAVPQLYAAICTVIIMGAMLVVYNWQMALAVLWVVPVAGVVFYLSKQYQSASHTTIYHLRRDISDSVQEDLDSIHEIKSYNQEHAYASALNEKLDHYENHLIKSELTAGALINVTYMILKLGLPSVLLVGAYLLSAGTISIFTYLAFLIITSRIYNPVMEVMNNAAMLLYVNVRINRIKEMNAMPRQEGFTVFRPKNYNIEFKNVSFSYLEGIQTLKNVSFTAKQGDVTALVGPSGGGKSTVAKLSARFWDANQGQVLLGGYDISKVDPETLLQYYSIVFQDVTLFNASVMDNIRLGRKDATDQEVIEAARLAQCSEFISSLPNGYHTMIGENGEKLSGGERQRISIARAILKDAPIILLDEATASLDAENESKIQHALSVLVQNKTVLVIAHRMRTVAGADQIIVLKDGKIAESGSPSVLNQKQGIFAAMLNAQYRSV